MNVFLKAAVDEVMDLEASVEAGVKKDWTGLFSKLLKAGLDIPVLLQNLGDAKAEAEALLKDPASSADLLAYIGSKLSGAGQPAQIAAIVVSVADLVLSGALLEPKVEAVIASIRAVKAPVQAVEVSQA